MTTPRSLPQLSRSIAAEPTVSGDRDAVLGKNRWALELAAYLGFVSAHPSSLLRAPEEQSRNNGCATVFVDLKSARKFAAQLKAA